jgi:hypothetical protein
MMIMEIKLYTFSEALEKLKNKEIPMLIRAKYMKADFQNRCILLYKTEKYVGFHYSFTSGSPDILWQTVQNDEGGRTGSYASIDSEDILAEDYVDTSTWTLYDYPKEYENAKKDKQ